MDMSNKCIVQSPVRPSDWLEMREQLVYGSVKRSMKTPVVWLLCLSVLVPLGLMAQPMADTFRILPIFDALTGSYPTDQFVTEANRLKAQIGQNRTNFKVGFSFIYPDLAN